MKYKQKFIETVFDACFRCSRHFPKEKGLCIKYSTYLLNGLRLQRERKKAFKSVKLRGKSVKFIHRDLKHVLLELH